MDFRNTRLNSWAASIIRTRTLRHSSIFKAGKLSCFGGVLDLVHLHYFCKHGCQGSNFSEFVCYFFQFCLLYAKILEICSNRLCSFSSLILYVHNSIAVSMIACNTGNRGLFPGLDMKFAMWSDQLEKTGNGQPEMVKWSTKWRCACMTYDITSIHNWSFLSTGIENTDIYASPIVSTL